MAATDRPETAASDAVWRRLVERAIGAPVETLQSRSADGLILEPLYARAPADPQQPWRALEEAWSVAQRIDHPAAETANSLALLDLEGGADALVLVDPASPYSRGFGYAGHDLDRVFAEIDLDFIGVRLDAGPRTAAMLSAFTGLVTDHRLTSAALKVDIGFDPIGWRARLGHDVDDDPHPILEVRAKAGLAGTAFFADGRPWHEAGAGEAQEMAAVLATAVAYLRRQEELGLSLDAARTNIAVLLAADADVVLGLAKFRAMRRLWARLESACKLAPKPLHLQAETSWRMMTRRDPWTNVMRATAATFSAGLGGADTIHVLPFTLPLGLPDAGARRLARNIQRVLLDEAHLAEVVDPAAGAGGFEALTEGLCETAWGLFQEIEREGGIARAIERGTLKGRIAETAAARAQEIARGTRGIVGTSLFASLHAPDVAVLDIAPRPAPARGDGALPALRDAEPFEALRDRADALPGRPRVFLATLGPPASFGARATYAANVFAAGGIVAEIARETRDVAALAAAFIASKASVACLCGSDTAYALEGAAARDALRSAGARLVFAVGETRIEEVDARLHDGCDALRILRAILQTEQS